MKKHKHQTETDNPGWHGTGVPTIQKLTLSKMASLLRELTSWELRRFLNHTGEILANFANFHVWPRMRCQVECPCCGWMGSSFVATSNWRAITFQSRCPQCDSRSRHRGLFKILQELTEKAPKGDILFFAPEGVLLKWLRSQTNSRVRTTDLNSIDADYPNEDIQELSFEANRFSMILCNHVLEHVPNDRKAFRECARVLKHSGIAIFTVPGDYEKRKTRNYDRKDSSGHFRHYGMDVVEKMKEVFASVEAIDMGSVVTGTHGVRKGDYAFVCVKEHLAINDHA